MRSAGTILCAIPSGVYGGQPQSGMAAEVLRHYLPTLQTIERRLKKQVSVDVERTRYARLCRQIEDVTLSCAQPAAASGSFAAVLRNDGFPAIRVGGAYVELLARLHAMGRPLGVAHETRLGSSIFEPDELKKHLKQFRALAKHFGQEARPGIRERIAFLENRLIPHGCGLIEISDPLSVSLTEEELVTDDAMYMNTWWERFKLWLRIKLKGVPTPTRLEPPQSGWWQPTQDVDWQEYREGSRGEFMKDRLRTQIQRALEGGAPIHLGNQRHNMLIPELERFLYKVEGQSPHRAAMSYENGQPVRDFPLHCLDPLPDGWTCTRELHVGLVSMRHLPIDQYIDLNWYRNVEVPSHQGLSGADEACYLITRDQLASLLDQHRGHRLRIYLYHTGFLPAVVGFYRGLVEALASGEHPRGCLQVVPMLQPKRKGDGHLTGRPWPS